MRSLVAIAIAGYAALHGAFLFAVWGMSCDWPLSMPGGRAEQTSGVYKKASMQHTSFGDVDNLRIGATGYVYCHQGCCEHALYIKDIRRIHSDDPQRASAYPVQTFQVSRSSVQACLEVF